METAYETAKNERQIRMEQERGKTNEEPDSVHRCNL